MLCFDLALPQAVQWETRARAAEAALETAERKAASAADRTAALEVC